MQDNQGAGIARHLANPQHGNLAVALLSRNAENLKKLTADIRASQPDSAPLEPFPCDTNPANLSETFAAISSHPSFQNLKLRLAIYHVKHSSKKPFLEETAESFGESLQTYTTGAFAFAQEALKMLYAQNGGATSLADTNGIKKGTIIFTGTLGAMRTNAEFSAYGATRSGARSVAQGLAKEVSKHGVHVVHAILNGGVRDEDSVETRTGVRMSAEAVGKAYLWLESMDASCWVHELDLRPAQEKF